MATGSQDKQSFVVEVIEEQYFQGLPEQFARLADVTLVAEGVELRVHQAILAANSPFFGDIFLSALEGKQESSGSRLRCPLPGDKLDDVVTLLRYCYQCCTLFSSSKPCLGSAKDACSLARFAHKYDMQALLRECEAFLTVKAKAVETSNNTLDITSILEWASLADGCGMTDLLAHCELIMAKTWGTSLWQDSRLTEADSISRSCLLRVLRAAQHHMVASEQRMQQMTVNRYNNFHTGASPTCHAGINDLVKWRQPTFVPVVHHSPTSSVGKPQLPSKLV